MIKLYGCVKGSAKRIEDVDDEMFSQKMLGDGIAVVPEDDSVYSPSDGIITAMFPTGHAVGITVDDCCEVLIHIGIDTVEMNGKGFKTYVKQGDSVKQGDRLIEFDRKLVAEAGYSSDVIMIVTNTPEFSIIKKTSETNVDSSTVLLSVIK